MYNGTYVMHNDKRLIPLRQCRKHLSNVCVLRTTDGAYTIYREYTIHNNTTSIASTTAVCISIQDDAYCIRARDRYYEGELRVKVDVQTDCDGFGSADISCKITRKATIACGERIEISKPRG